MGRGWSRGTGRGTGAANDACAHADEPPPHSCGTAGFDGFQWARSDPVNTASRARSRCPHSFDIASTLFTVASFDVAASRKDEDVELLAQTILTSAPPGAPPGSAHAALARALKNGVVTHQAAAYPDSYVGMVPWPAWAAGGVGPIAYHYSYVHEPYFMAKASASLPLFDEFYRGPGWDKNSYWLTAATTTHTNLVLLPDVFLLNARNAGKRTADRASNSRVFWGYCAAHGITCPSRCVPSGGWDIGATQQAALDAALRLDADALRAARDALEAAVRERGGRPNAAPMPASGACDDASRFEDGVDYLTDSARSKAGSAADCCAQCADQPGCVAWTWRGPLALQLRADEWRDCFLKPVATGRRVDEKTVGLTSGVLGGGRVGGA